jgi:hypothetical protein
MTQLSFNHAAVSGETRMTMTLKTLASLFTATFLLAGCASMNIFKDDNTPPPLANDLPPEEPLVVAPPPAAGARGLKAAQISKILSGKSWKWSAPNFSGVTLYANDGSSLIEVTGKGTTTGKWYTKDGELCESIAPAPFLPGGQGDECRKFSGNGNNFTVGKAKFALAI